MGFAWIWGSETSLASEERKKLRFQFLRERCDITATNHGPVLLVVVGRGQ